MIRHRTTADWGMRFTFIAFGIVVLFSLCRVAFGAEATPHNDEDGVTWRVMPIVGKVGVAEVDLSYSDVGGKLSVWVNFRPADGKFDLEDRVKLNMSLEAGKKHLIEFPVPSWAVPGKTLSRWRISINGQENPDDESASGEGEDHICYIMPDVPRLDYCDGPASYGRCGHARHNPGGPGPKLGRLVDVEDAPRYSDDADGDDVDQGEIVD